MKEQQEELTPREQAIKVITVEKGSVVVEGITYTLTGVEGSNTIRSLKELPGEEVFVGNDSALRTSTLAKMSAQMEEYKARYEALKKTSEVEVVKPKTTEETK